MTHNLTPGVFKIVSLQGNSPVGVNLTLPGFQFVYLNAPVTTWTVRVEGDKTYLLSVGGYPFTGVEEKVIATIHREQNIEWIATYRELQEAYTISPINDDINGWTVANVDDTNAEIALSPIVSTKSIPPQFLPSQLFRFERIHE